MKFAGGPSATAVTAQDLMTRLYRYADDSMSGRAAGTEGNLKATAYIAAEFRRLGLQPAGNDGGYLQDVEVRGAPLTARNVVAVLPGSDPVLRHQYVAIGAHNDHVGTARTAVADHDSARAVALSRERASRLIPDTVAGAARRARIRELQPPLLAALLDTLRRRHPVPRRDSIFNGADDDGSGTVALLELAEAFAGAPVKPKRSILFVSHTAEELGLVGSKHFMNAPTVPRDSIVAAINLDMIGRGTAEDLPQGGARHLDVVGSRRLSTQFGDLVEAVNSAQTNPFALDYRYAPEGHRERIYCRSDHWNYAKYGIPVAFFFTGLHADYHKITDEPQYIDYDKLWRVTRLVYDILARVGDLPERPVVDKPVPADGKCR